MANRYLRPIYKMLYDQDFEYTDFDNRMQMQKAVYLLQAMGVPMGGYGFRWYKHGPYSQDLHDDMFHENIRSERPIQLHQEFEEQISKLHDIIHDPHAAPYNTAQWMECLASMRYLKENIMAFDSSREAVIAELERRKPHLNRHDVNEYACGLLEGMFA